MKVLTLRLPEEDLMAIEEISVAENVDKSTAARELIELGRAYFAIKNYKEGKISIGKAAELAVIAISEMMDLHSQLGIENKIDMTDYLAGTMTAKRLLR